MQLRHAIAAVLSFVLLGASSVASACELSCSLMPSHSISMRLSAAPADLMKGSPAAQANQADDSATRSHSHCGHAAMGRHSNAVDRNFQDASTCTSAPCTQAQILSSPINGIDGRQIESGQRAVAAASVSPVSAIGNPSHIVKLEHAPRKIVLLNPLAVALRI